MTAIGGWQGGLTDILRILQRLYESAVASLDNMRSASTSGLLLLIVAAFAFGMLHALLPGHGKSVLASYYAGDGRLMGALSSSVVRLHPILARAEWWRQKGSHWLEIGAAFAVFALGLWPLLR